MPATTTQRSHKASPVATGKVTRTVTRRIHTSRATLAGRLSGDMVWFLTNLSTKNLNLLEVTFADLRRRAERNGGDVIDALRQQFAVADAELIKVCKKATRGTSQ